MSKKNQWLNYNCPIIVTFLYLTIVLRAGISKLCIKSLFSVGGLFIINKIHKYKIALNVWRPQIAVDKSFKMENYSPK